MMKPDESLQVFVPLKVGKQNGRPKILPPATYLPSEYRTHHMSCAPSAERGAGGGAWKLACETRLPIW